MSYHSSDMETRGVLCLRILSGKEVDNLGVNIGLYTSTIRPSISLIGIGTNARANTRMEYQAIGSLKVYKHLLHSFKS
jgi:hypothetical protein